MNASPGNKWTYVQITSIPLPIPILSNKKLKKKEFKPIISLIFKIWVIKLIIKYVVHLFLIYFFKILVKFKFGVLITSNFFITWHYEKI